MSNFEYTYHRAPDGTFYRVHTEPDTDAESPRGYDNVTTMVTWDSRYLSPDRYQQGTRELPADDIGAESLFDATDTDPARRLHLYVKLYRPDVLAAVPLVRSGYDGTIGTDESGTGHLIGVGYVTTDDWAKMMGETPTDGSTGSPTPLAAIEQDVEIYNTWARGEYVGYVVEQAHVWSDTIGNTMATWEDAEDADPSSVWGFDDEAYARQEAVATLPNGTEEVAESDLPDEVADAS